MKPSPPTAALTAQRRSRDAICVKLGVRTASVLGGGGGAPGIVIVCNNRPLIRSSRR